MEKEESRSCLVKLLTEVVPGIDIDRLGVRRNAPGKSFGDSYAGPLVDMMLSSIEHRKGCKTAKPKMTLESADPLLMMMKDQVVVDLGCGSSLAGYAIACLAGAKAYIGVDPFSPNRDIDSVCSYSKTSIKKVIKPYTDLSNGKKLKCIPGLYVREDMLRFLKRLPQESVSMLISGIDDYVLDDDKYVADVKSEIARALHTEGVCVSYASRIHPRELKRFNLSFTGGHVNVHCYYKNMPTEAGLLQNKN